MLVHLAPAKKVVAHHAADKHIEQGGQDRDKQESYKSKPRNTVFFLTILLPIRRHVLLSLLVRQLTSQIESVHGSCICCTLLQGYDLNTPLGRQSFKQNDLLNTICKSWVQRMVGSVETIL
ncbi:MAG: hypothetical protein ACLQM6_11700 [Acidobacteriaceae bacterium]